MTLTNAYATLAQFKAVIGLDDAVDDARAELAISAASRQIDRHCDRFFYVTTSQSRSIDAVEDCWCAVPDISSTTGLTIKLDQDLDGTFEKTLTISTDFVLEPLDAASRYPVEPWTAIRMVGDYTIPVGRRPGLQVTALFGWPAVPDEITQACVVQARDLFKGPDAQFGSYELGVSGIPMRVPFMHIQARALLEPFRKVAV